MNPKKRLWVHLISFHGCGYTLSGRTGSALVWYSEGRTFAAHSVQ